MDSMALQMAVSARNQPLETPAVHSNARGQNRFVHSSPQARHAAARIALASNALLPVGVRECRAPLLPFYQLELPPLSLARLLKEDQAPFDVPHKRLRQPGAWFGISAAARS